MFKIKKNEMGWSTWQVLCRQHMHTGFRWGNLRKRDHLEDPAMDDRIILTWTFKKTGWEY
jgi:hypothetical protein